MHAKKNVVTVLCLACTLFLLAAFCIRPTPDIADRVVDPLKEPITLHWKDAKGQVLGNIGALRTDQRKNGHELLFAMNGGMYTTTQAPLGLYVENGVQLQRLNRSKGGDGNFQMQPNGVFGIRTDGRAFVCVTADYGEQPNVRYATQSGPMLLVKGAINAQFKPGSKNLNIRNGVGIRPDGKVMFAISREPINFHDFADHFKRSGCTEALYLDGAISRAFIPEEGLEQLDGTLGVLIAVVR